MNSHDHLHRARCLLAEADQIVAGLDVRVAGDPAAADAALRAQLAASHVAVATAMATEDSGPRWDDETPAAVAAADLARAAAEHAEQAARQVSGWATTALSDLATAQDAVNRLVALVVSTADEAVQLYIHAREDGAREVQAARDLAVAGVVAAAMEAAARVTNSSHWPVLRPPAASLLRDREDAAAEPVGAVRVTAAKEEVPALLRERLFTDLCRLAASNSEPVLADMLEIIYALGERAGASPAQLEETRIALLDTAGGYAGRRVRIWTGRPGDPE